MGKISVTKYVLVPEKKPESWSHYFRYYNYLNEKYKDKPFTKDQAIKLFLIHTCYQVSDTMFRQLLAQGCIS